MESRSSRIEKAVSYRTSGNVQHHRGRGKSLQAPTLNLPAPADIPDGIYAGYVTILEQRYPAAVFVGAAVTYDETERQVEIHVLDQKLAEVVACSVELLYFIRPNQRFASSVALQQQIAADIIQIRQCLQASSKSN